MLASALASADQERDGPASALTEVLRKAGKLIDEDVGVAYRPQRTGDAPDTLLRISSERYGRPAEVVDREIREALGVSFPN